MQNLFAPIAGNMSMQNMMVFCWVVYFMGVCGIFGKGVLETMDDIFSMIGLSAYFTFATSLMISFSQMQSAAFRMRYPICNGFLCYFYL